jgi:hypothetical protein
MSGMKIKGVPCHIDMESLHLENCGGPKVDIIDIDGVPFAECSKEKQEAARAVLYKAQAKGEGKMGNDNLITLDQIKDLIKADRISPSDIFDVQQLRDDLRDREAIDKARDEEHKKILAEGDKAIADGKRFKAAMDAIGHGGDKADKGGDDEAELPDALNPKKNPFIKLD